MTAPQFLAKLKIENFPSRVELLTLIDNYLSSNGLPSNYKAINQDNQILLMLHNPDIAYSIIRKLKIEQTKNNLYLKIKTSLTLTPLIQSKDIKNSNSTTNLKTSNSTTTIKKKKNLSQSTRKLHTDTNVVKYKINKNNNNSKSKKVFDSMLLEQTPYIDANERRKMEEKKSRLLWIDKRGFNPFVGKATTLKNENFIQNYVMETPSEPPVTHKFRDIHKEKWISKRTFIL